MFQVISKDPPSYTAELKAVIFPNFKAWDSALSSVIYSSLCLHTRDQSTYKESHKARIQTRLWFHGDLNLRLHLSSSSSSEFSLSNLSQDEDLNIVVKIYNILTHF